MTTIKRFGYTSFQIDVFCDMAFQTFIILSKQTFLYEHFDNDTSLFSFQYVFSSPQKYNSDYFQQTNQGIIYFTT